MHNAMQLLALIVITFHDACDIVENTSHVTWFEEGPVADAIASALITERTMPRNFREYAAIASHHGGRAWNY